MKKIQSLTAQVPLTGKTPSASKQKHTDNKKTRDASSDHLHHLAFDNSLQANLISTVRGSKIIKANIAACRLLGYSRKELLTRTSKNIFNTGESSFKKMVKERTAIGHGRAFTTAIKKSGKQFPCEITSVVFLGDNGIKKSITTIVDMSQSVLKQKYIDTKKEKLVAEDIVLAQLKSDTSLAENNEWIKYIAKTSYDVMWDWDITTNEIYVGDSCEEVFGYKVHGNKINFSDWIQCLHPEEKDSVEKKLQKAVASGKKSWDDNYRFIRFDGSEANTTTRASIIRNKDGKAIRMIGAMQDVSMLQVLEEKLQQQIITQKKEKKELNERFLITTKVSHDIIWEWDLITNQLYIGDGFEELFGYEIPDNMSNVAFWRNYIHPEDLVAFESGMLQAIQSNATRWKHAYRLIKASGAIANVLDRGNIMRDKDGKAIRMIGAMQDLGQQVKLQKDLELEIALKEKLLSNSQLHQLIFENTLYANILSDGKGNIIDVNDAACKLFGYSKKELIKKGRQGILNCTDGRLDKLLKERDIHGAMNGELTCIKKSGKNFACEVSSVIFKTDTAEQRAINTIIDISGNQKNISTKKEMEVLENEIKERTKAGKLLAENNEQLKDRFNSSSDVLWDLNILTNEVNISDGYEKLFGYEIKNNMIPGVIWTSHIHPDDKEELQKDLYKTLASAETKWEYRYRFLRADGSEVNVLSRGIIQRNPDGKAFRMTGSMQDLNRQKELEEKLRLEMALKGKQIADAVMEAQQLERADIGKELHDNVNQLLSASGLYQDMAREDGENREKYFSRSSEYRLAAIEEIRKLSRGLVTNVIKDIGLCEAIRDIVKDTMEVHPVNISCAFNQINEKKMKYKFKLNVFRIVQEQLTNILQHAKATEVQISLSQNNDAIILTISDNGAGFDTTKKQKGIGIVNIKSRAELYGGIAEFVSQVGKGCILTATFLVNAIVSTKS